MVKLIVKSIHQYLPLGRVRKERVMYKTKRLELYELMQMMRIILIASALVMVLVITPIAINANAARYVTAVENTVSRTMAERVRDRNFRENRASSDGMSEVTPEGEPNLNNGEGNTVMQETVETESEETIETISWSTMHVGVDVATTYAEPNGEKLGEIKFASVVNVSDEPCEEGWAKIQYEEVECFIKAENLLTAEEMLENNQYLLAQILYSEAGGVSKDEMRLVGEVVLNRLTTEYWEFEPYCETILGVVKQYGQYPTTYRKIQNGLVPSNDAMEVAKALLLGEYERLLPEGCLWQTGFYPRWNVEVVVYPGNWELADGTVINVYHHYSVLKG